MESCLHGKVRLFCADADQRQRFPASTVRASANSSHGLFPLVQLAIDNASDLSSRGVTLDALQHQGIVIGKLVTDGGNNRQSDRLWIKPFCRCRAADSAARLKTGVLGDPICLRGRATRKRLDDSAGKAGDKFLVKLTFSYLFSFRLSPASVGVFQAFCFSFFDRLSLSQNTLPFVPFPRSAPL